MVQVLGGQGAVVFFGMSTAPFGHGGSINPFPPKLPISRTQYTQGEQSRSQKDPVRRSA